MTKHIYQDGDYICPKCKYSSDDGREWHMYFCPAWPDRCAGCDYHESKLECPECGHEWDLKDDPDAQGLE